ncbi:ligase-associated DNA damage response exonuclease [Achromobacter aloeverae]|uniref:DNA ligase-associated DEXH box helicase n=1 Tax=Achromobacter aloeverae TaxID=1750518 RepID=A0A4Q1HM41_9BURK|nr:ligase-associated DNA damage response exonuclease [Achromobacter aloeverae]RXN91336.1 DNA ligase-associated DEXH box helicase [Achromobacter aloeverae]
MDLIVARPEGLYCPPGDFHIDPWRPVDRAVITHAHADHARAGSRHYMAAAAGQAVLRQRLGDIDLQAVAYGAPVTHNGVRISLHPAGHVLGSAQVRVEHRGEVWVASGDYKLGDDPTCAPFEPVPCEVFITESTFGLPIYRWQSGDALYRQINAWWAGNAQAGRTSVLYCYAFGKAQRILCGLDTATGPVVVHGAVETVNRGYRAAGVALPPVLRADEVDAQALRRALVLAPPSARGTGWLRRFGDHADAFASGWMQVRGARRRRGVDRGFVLSDHADWPGLQTAIGACGASRVIVTHGQVAVLVRWLNELGIAAQAFETAYGDDENDAADAHEAPDTPEQSGPEVPQ